MAGGYKRKAPRAVARPRKSARKTWKRRSVTRSIPRSIVNVHHFRRMMAPVYIPGSITSAPLLSYIDYGFNGITNAGDFTGLYDQYRLNLVVSKVYLEVDPSAQTAATAIWPKIYWYRDRDDASAPGNLNEIRENAASRVAVLSPYRPVTITVKPNVLSMVYSTAVGSNYSPKWGVWLDMSTTTSQHYGFKFGIDNLTNTNYGVRIERTCYFSCRHSR